MDDWSIVPHQGVGPLRFGMTRADVELLLGPVEFSDGGEPDGRDFRVFEAGTPTHRPVVGYRDGRLTEIELFSFQTSARVGDVHVFQHPLTVTVAKLKAMSTHWFEGRTGHVFIDLGLSVGVESWDVSETITAFSRGVFDGVVRDAVADGSMQEVRPGF